MLLSVPSVAVNLYRAAPTEKCQYSVARLHDVYGEETESIVGRAMILSMAILVVIITRLAKG